MMLEAITNEAVTGASGLARTARAQTQSIPAVTGAAAGGGVQTAFDSVLGQLANDAMTSLKAGEAASVAGIQARASAQQVVDQMMSAERSLQLAIAVRDKVVQAYQELTRMAI
jgi:flagellar hook-basal body complex protein FliE